ncbi:MULTISPECIES: hypothetical protein [unclassified Streptomyces]|uniref:hypothetical protein n=1 Tax=unclassified Streptomyces TaxID=2593676 RepID=UPI0033306F50
MVARLVGESIGRHENLLRTEHLLPRQSQFRYQPFVLDHVHMVNRHFDEYFLLDQSRHLFRKERENHVLDGHILGDRVAIRLEEPGHRAGQGLLGISEVH